MWEDDGGVGSDHIGGRDVNSLGDGEGDGDGGDDGDGSGLGVGDNAGRLSCRFEGARVCLEWASCRSVVPLVVEAVENAGVRAAGAVTEPTISSEGLGGCGLRRRAAEPPNIRSVMVAALKMGEPLEHATRQ